MNNKELEKKKRAIWRQKENEYHITIPEVVRKPIENFYDWREADIDLEDFQGSADDWVKVLAIYSGYILKKTQLRSEKHQVDSELKRVYHRSLEKRLYLVEFVTKNVLTLKNLIEHSFTPHNRIKWKKLTELWNNKHPYDTMEPDRLRTEFYRIIRDKRVEQEYFDRKDKIFTEPLADIFTTQNILKSSIEPIYETIEYIYSLLHNIEKRGDKKRLQIKP